MRSDPLAPCLVASFPTSLQNLFVRYGRPLIILSLVKSTEPRPRESVLRTALSAAVAAINVDLPARYKLAMWHVDVHRLLRRGGAASALRAPSGRRLGLRVGGPSVEGGAAERGGAATAAGCNGRTWTWTRIS